jgi:hypothetical protein
MEVVFDEVQIGDKIEFVYNGKVRLGHVEMVSQIKHGWINAGKWYAVIKADNLLFNGDGYKCFRADKMKNIKLLSQW